MKRRELKEKIELTTQGQLSLFFPGTGSAFTKLNFQNNILVIKGQDHLLIDCGNMCPYAFHTFNSSITSISNFLITHSHADHAGGLEEVALMNMYITKKKPNMIITDEYKKILWNKTLSGGLAIRGEETGRQKMYFDDYFTQIKPKKLKNSLRPMYEANIGSINVKLFRTKHLFSSKNNWKNSFYSLGVLIDNRILFSGDTKADKELINWMCDSYNIEYIIHDCQFYKNAVHAGYDELKEILTPEQKAKTLLCHYGDDAATRDVKKDGFYGIVERGVYYDFD